MITIYQTNNAKDAQNCIMQALSRTDQTNLDIRHVVIVPDRASYEAEMAILATLGGSFNTEVLTFRNLANRFLPEKDYLSKQAGIIALTNVINKCQSKFKCFKKVVTQNGFVEKMYDTICQLKYCNVTPEKLQSAELIKKLKDNQSLKGLHDKLHDIAIIYKAYQDFLGEEYVDSSAKLSLLHAELDKPNKIDNFHFYLYDFDNFSAQEYALIAQFAKHALSVTVACTASSNSRDSHLYLNDVLQGVKKVANDVGQTPTIVKSVARQNKHCKQIGNNLYRYVKLDKSIDNDNFLHVFQGTSRLQEVYALACQIHKYVRQDPQNNRYGQIYVVTSDVNKYKNAIRTVFDEFAIPYFCDVKTPLDFHPYSQFLLDYLQLFKSNFDVKHVLSFVKNPLFIAEENDKYNFENYCYKYNPTRRFSSTFELGQKEQTYLSAESLRADLMQIVSLYEFKGNSTANEYVQLLRKMVVELSLPSRCNQLNELQLQSNFANHAKTTQQVVEKFDGVLEQISKILADTTLELSQFVSILSTALKTVNLSVLPEKTDRVMVVNMAKSRKHDIGFLALLGANAGAMPRVESDCKMLTDKNIHDLAKADKEIDIQPTIETENKRERFALFQLLQEPTKKLFVSYATSDGSTALSPSSFVSQLCNLFKEKKLNEDNKLIDVPVAKMETADENVYTHKQMISKLALSTRKEKDNQPVSMPNYKLLYDAFKDEIDKYAQLSDGKIEINNGKDLFLQNKEVSVSKLTTFFTCPYKFYFRYGLGIQKREESQLQSNVLGDILHKVLENYVKKIKLDETDAQTTKIAQKLFDNALKNDFYKGLLEDESNKNTLKLLKKEAVKLCKVVKDQFATSNFVNYATEMEFGEDKEYKSVSVKFGDEEFLLNGKIDRVDVNGNNFIIIDYKSGGESGSTFNETGLYNGQKLQLLVYLKAVLDNCNFSNSNANNQSDNSSDCNQDDSECKPNPVGFYYFNIHDDFSKDKSNNYKYSGRSIKDMEICKQLDTALANDKKSARLGVTFAKAKDDKGKEIPGKLDFSVNSHVLTANQLMAEIDYALMLIAKAGQLIKDGYVAINPIEKCCDYCDYSSICDYQDIHNYPARKETKANADQIEEIVKNAKKKKRI